MSSDGLLTRSRGTLCRTPRWCTSNSPQVSPFPVESILPALLVERLLNDFMLCLFLPRIPATTCAWLSDGPVWDLIAIRSVNVRAGGNLAGTALVVSSCLATTLYSLKTRCVSVICDLSCTCNVVPIVRMQSSLSTVKAVVCSAVRTGCPVIALNSASV